MTPRLSSRPATRPATVALRRVAAEEVDGGERFATAPETGGQVDELRQVARQRVRPAGIEPVSAAEGHGDRLRAALPGLPTVAEAQRSSNREPFSGSQTGAVSGVAGLSASAYPPPCGRTITSPTFGATEAPPSGGISRHDPRRTTWRPANQRSVGKRCPRGCHRTRAEAVVREPYGATTMSPPHERDSRRSRCALTGDGHDGAACELTGPETLAWAEEGQPGRSQPKSKKIVSFSPCRWMSKR